MAGKEEEESTWYQTRKGSKREKTALESEEIG
jgi:hypothetical protein